MADLRIVDAPEIPTEDITGEEKLPTGGSGNYSISLDSLADYTKTKKDLVDTTAVDGKVNGVRQELDAHIEDLLNPHQVTKGQIGLGNVDNTADADKPVSNSTQAAIISAVSPKAEKTYVDSQLALKANKVDVYTKSETYTKQESSDLVNSSISTVLIPVNTSLDLAKRGVVNRYDPLLTYNSGERVVLANGDIVKSTIDGNVNDPNVDMFGWVNSELEQKFKTAEILTPEMFGAVGDNVTDDTQALIDMFKACTNMPIGSGISANEIRSKLNSNNYKVVRLTKRYRHTKPIHIPPNIRIEQCVSGFFSKNGGTNGLFYDPIDSELDTYAVAPFLYKKDSDGTYSLDTSPYTLPSGGAFDRAEYIQTGQRILIDGLSVITKQGVTLGFRFVGFSGSIANYINVGTNDGSSSRIPKVAILTNACWNAVFTKPTTLSSHQGWVNWGSNGGMVCIAPYVNKGYNSTALASIEPVYKPTNHTENGAIGIVNSGDCFWDQPITESWYFSYVATTFLRIDAPHIEGNGKACFYFIGGVGADINLKGTYMLDQNIADHAIVYVKDVSATQDIVLRGNYASSYQIVNGVGSVACVSVKFARNQFFIQSGKWGDINLIRYIENSWGNEVGTYGADTVYIDPINGDDTATGLGSVGLKTLDKAKRLCDLMGIKIINIKSDLTFTNTVVLPSNVTITGQAIVGSGVNAVLRASGKDMSMRFNNTRLANNSNSLLYLNGMAIGEIIFDSKLDCLNPFIQAQNNADIDIIATHVENSPRAFVYGNTSYQQSVGLTLNPAAILASTLLSGNAYMKHCNLNKVSVTYDPPSIAAGESVTTTVTIPATPVGTPVSAAFSIYNANIEITAVISAANTATVRFKNVGSTSVDLASGTLTVKKL